MEGWIKIHRKLLNWEWYDDNNTKVLFLHLLLTANYEEKKWRGQTIKRGELITSIQHLAEETHLTVKQVRVALDKLKRTNEIETKGQCSNTLVTIVKYGDYQVEEKEKGKQRASEKANEGQSQGKQRATTKEEKKERNEEEKNIKIHFAEFVNMTNAEYEKLVSTHGKEFADQCIEELDNYKGANGKKYASDYRAILNWVVDKVKQKKPNKQNTSALDNWLKKMEEKEKNNAI